MDKIFINNYGHSHDWIMGKIALDIQREAQALGYECRCGELEDYRGEEICYHMSYAYGVPITQAKHNSIFYTHINYQLMEEHFSSLKEQFDSFICMSPEDVQYLIELGFDKNKVFGKVLPVRNTYIRPISIGIFSACYNDGRKNEQWLIDYCRNNEKSKLVNFVFVGAGWGRVVEELGIIGCSFEWHNVSRKLPFEYQFQQNKLADLNYYIYMGLDGGAMGTYDAYAQDVPLCVTYDGFHKALPCIDYAFDNKSTFFSQLDKIISQHADRLNFFKANNPENYVKWIIDVWKGNVNSEILEKDKKCISYNSVVEKKREQYYPTNMSRVKKYLQAKLTRIKIKQEQDKLFKK